MPRLEDFKKSLLDMTPEEAMELIRFIREDRRTPKRAEKQASVKRKTTGSKVEKMLANLSPEDLARLMKEMGI